MGHVGKLADIISLFNDSGGTTIPIILTRVTLILHSLHYYEPFSLTMGHNAQTLVHVLSSLRSMKSSSFHSHHNSLTH